MNMFNRRLYLPVIVILLTCACMRCYAAVQEIRWISGNPRMMVSASRGYEQITSNTDHWEGSISEPNDPVIEFSKTPINASKSKFLYIKMAAQSGTSMQIFFAGAGKMTEELSFRAGLTDIGDDPVIYRFDLSKFPLWKGDVRYLRLDLDFAEKGSRLKLYGIGVSESSIGAPTGTTMAEISISSETRYPSNRMAAYQDAIVATDEVRPVSCVTTYTRDPTLWTSEYILARFMPGIVIDGQTYWPKDARNLTVEDEPGSAVAAYSIKGVRVTTQIIPLMIGRDTTQQDGAAVYVIKTSPAVPVVIKCGGSEVTGLEVHRMGTMRKDEMPTKNDSIEMRGNIAFISSKIHKLKVAVKGDGKITTENGSDGGQYGSIKIPGGSGNVMVSFAEDMETAQKLIATDIRSALADVSRYYGKLMRSRIETPVVSMNQAFSSALYNLEYNWANPIGWVECIDHWPALWHMQHTGGADWIGQSDRSQLCNLTTAQNIYASGAIPQFYPGGFTHRDFGGSNQFFMWQVRHNWNMTADKDSIRKLDPYLDRVIAQTFQEYDRESDGLLAWGQQIGNQEDYSSTPFNGTAASIEGINILKTGAEIKRALGQISKAEEYEAKASQALGLLRKELWQPDLGMYNYFKDPFGEVRPDGLYHSLIYPVMWGVTDPIDSWTSIRHMRDRLTGSNGEVYCSNTFPNHVGGTWGMQAGVAQQPWAAWGLSAVGLRNETYRPLKAASEWVMDANHRGSWPEIASESTASYFSPPAGLYIQSVIEAVFGLNMRKPEGKMVISPSFPDSWPSAKLVLPEYGATYTRTGNTIKYMVMSKDPIAREIKWMLPPCGIKRFTVNGTPARYEVNPGVGIVTLRANIAAARTTDVLIEIDPVKSDPMYSRSVAEGDTFTVSMPGCTIKEITDRSGVLASNAFIDKSAMKVTVKRGLLKECLKFGRLGQMNFSRRSFFLTCTGSNGAEFIQPIDITILPAAECAQKGGIRLSGNDAVVDILVRNNSSSVIKGTAWLGAAQHSLPFKLNLKGRSECVSAVRVPSAVLALFSPGQNSARVILPDKRELELIILADVLFRPESKLAEYAGKRIAHIALPEKSFIEDTEWRKIREFYAYGHYPWAGSRPPLESLADKPEITVPGLPGVSFALNGRKFIPVSWRYGTPEFTLDLSSAQYKKLYLLVLPFFDNHDTFASVGRVTAKLDNGGIISRTLAFPGDLDWWCPEEVVGVFSTARNPRPDRFGLAPLLKAGVSDWSIARPLAFPQPEYWATSIPYKTRSSVMNVIEIDLGMLRQVKTLTLSTTGVDPAFGLAAVSAEQSGYQDVLDGTPWQLEPGFREPRILFRFDKPGDLNGWRTEGPAFYVAPVPSLFMVPTLNSLAAKGEAVTGKAFSPDFVIGEEFTHLRFILQGGNAKKVDGVYNLAVELVDSSTSEVLATVPILGSHLLREELMSVTGAAGRKVHLRLRDDSTASSYAWLGVQEVALVTL